MGIMNVLPVIFLFMVAINSASAFFRRPRHRLSPAACSGSATYNVTFFNMLSPTRFGTLIPSTGLVFSPLTVASHSGRVSILTVRGYASPEVKSIAETGDNGPLLNTLGTLQRVRSFAAAYGGTMPEDSVTVTVDVDCSHQYISGIAMIAPSPDWIVQLSNVNLFGRRGFKYRHYGRLIAYDAGTDDGKDFTNPGDSSLDLPTVPQKNIVPLVEDDTDPFEGRVVGKYMIKKIM